MVRATKIKYWSRIRFTVSHAPRCAELGTPARARTTTCPIRHGGCRQGCIKRAGLGTTRADAGQKGRARRTHLGGSHG
jgi:hypothetical protein